MITEQSYIDLLEKIREIAQALLEELPDSRGFPWGAQHEIKRLKRALEELEQERTRIIKRLPRD